MLVFYCWFPEVLQTIMVNFSLAGFRGGGIIMVQEAKG